MNTRRVLIASDNETDMATALSTLSEGQGVAMPVASKTSPFMKSRIKLSGDSQVEIFSTKSGLAEKRDLQALDVNLEALILLVDNRDEHLKQRLHEGVRLLEAVEGECRLAVGVTHMDESDVPVMAVYHHWLGELSVKAPVFEVDVRCKRDLQILVQALELTLNKAA